MTLMEIDQDIHRKIDQNDKYIRYSYFELRVTHNLSEDEIKTFLQLAKNKLENMNYKVYFTGDNYVFENVNRTVGDNEYLIAIKEV